MKVIKLREGKERSLLRRHPWVFEGSIARGKADSGETVRKVPSTRANVNFRGRTWYVPQAFCGEHLAIRPLDRDGLYGVFFGATQIAKIDLDAKQ